MTEQTPNKTRKKRKKKLKQTAKSENKKQTSKLVGYLMKYGKHSMYVTNHRQYSQLRFLTSTFHREIESNRIQFQSQCFFLIMISILSRRDKSKFCLTFMNC